MFGRRPRRPALPASGALVDERGRVVCADCVVAIRMIARMRGLLGRAGLEPGAGLLIPRTSSIHTFFMRFALDAVFLDRDLRVHAIARNVVPGRAVWRRGARHVLELAAGESARAGIEEGSRLAWRDPGSEAGTLRGRGRPDPSTYT